ncbi:MAG: 2'-deoxycytidine 5'-triphosphate deaminase [Candidatus Tectimicrobiota bacterium]
MSLRPGVLPFQWLRRATEENWVYAPQQAVEPQQLQPASLDLRLGPVAYRIRSSFLPGREPVAQKLASLTMYDIPLTAAAVLERGHVYLIPLLEELALPPYLRGRTNPKSSTGRLDIFTRVITDAHQRFDDIRPGYQGRLYLEVFSRSFTIKVHQGLSLNQLRLFFGDAPLDDVAMRRLYQIEPLLYDDHDQPIPLEEVHFEDGLFMGLATASQAETLVGFKAKKNSDVIDLSRVGYYDPSAFWEPVRCSPSRPLILEPEEFYILTSKEKVRIPPAYAAELVAYDAGSGELRTHYAGFFDPGFGYGHGEQHGTKAVLEVRPHDVPFLVEDGQLFCKLCLESTAETPAVLYGAELHSHYQTQTLTLGKQFLPWHSVPAWA